ncbi:protein fantom [Synchiropus picturatus]
MSMSHDETAADEPVRDFPVARLVPSNRLPVPLASDFLNIQNTRAKQDASRMTRDDLEDRYLRLVDETLLLKQQVNQRDDKIKKLGTKLMRLVKDRGRMEQLAVGVGAAAGGKKDMAMGEMVEEAQEKVRDLQMENERLKQRLQVAQQQLLSSPSKRQTAYEHVSSRVNSGMKKLRDDTSSPWQSRPRSARSLDGARRATPGLLPRYGHSLLEEARAEIRNLENVIESQTGQIEEMENNTLLLQQQMKKKEEEYQENLLQARQQQTSKLRSHVNTNMSVIKLQQQLAERSNTVTELEARFIHLQESQSSLKVSHEAAMKKVDELSSRLKDERMKNLDLQKNLERSDITKSHVEQLKERIKELEQENNLLKENNETLMNSVFDVSQQQKWQAQEQQLKIQICQLETALKNDLLDKNHILDRVKSETDKNEKLMEENQRLHIQSLKLTQQVEELREQLKIFTDVNQDPTALTEALLHVQRHRSQQGTLQFLKDSEQGDRSSLEETVRELRAAHSDTIQELEKTRSLLRVENQITQDYKAELQAVLQKMESDKLEFKKKLEHQGQLLDSREARVKKLEGQLRDVAYSTRALALKPDQDQEESVILERGEDLLELQIVSATLNADALKALGDDEPSTFCTYSFYLFELHSTPVATGPAPQYGFTSRYVVDADQRFLDYLQGLAVNVEMHQALGLSWRTFATATLPMHQLLSQEGQVHGRVPLIGVREELQTYGSLDYWFRLRVPIMEAFRQYQQRVAAESYISTGDSERQGGKWNHLLVSVESCTGLQSRTLLPPSPYVVYKFFQFPDQPTATVHDCSHPHFHDQQTYPVLMDSNLEAYLQSDFMCFYVFDYKEEQTDRYLGKAQVSLLPLLQNQSISGVHELSDPNGLPAGHLELSISWKFPYVSPTSVRLTRSLPVVTQREEAAVKEEPTAIGHPTLNPEQEPMSGTSARQTHARREEPQYLQAAPKLRADDATFSRKVTFVESTEKKVQFEVIRGAEEDHEELESRVSEGQLLSPSCSEESDFSVDTDVTEKVAKCAASDPILTDSDDCIIHRTHERRKGSDQVCVEVVSLSLRPDSTVALDNSVVRLFVEYSFLDLRAQETPLSLPKPQPGRCASYNYSRVIAVDQANHQNRRKLLRDILQGQNPQMERIHFTVVSEPPEEEEQVRDCEEVGTTHLRIADVIDRQEDLIETNLNVVAMANPREQIGTLTISFRALEALQDILKEPVKDALIDSP